MFLLKSSDTWVYSNVQDCMQMAYGYKKSYGKRRTSSNAAYWRGVRAGKRMARRRRY